MAGGFTAAAAASFAGKLRSGLTAAVGTQIGLTMASWGYATGRWGGTDRRISPLLIEAKTEAEAVFDAHHYDLVTAFVTDMYAAGRGVSTSPAQQKQYVQLADTVTFEDPVARCCGPFEVQEAFRAMKYYLEPRSIRSPICVDVQPQGESIALSYALNQRYHFLGSTWNLGSLLVVTVQLCQLKEVPESVFSVIKMEEHWNGIPFWNSYLFRIVRRINGMVGCQLTKRLL